MGDPQVSGGPFAASGEESREFLACWDGDRGRPGGKMILCGTDWEAGNGVRVEAGVG